jgi:hypothetical protein
MPSSHVWRHVWLQPLTEISEYLAALFYTIKMESAGSSETLMNFYQATRRHVSEDSFLHSQRRENLKFHVCNSASK